MRAGRWMLMGITAGTLWCGAAGAAPPTTQPGGDPTSSPAVPSSTSTPAGEDTGLGPDVTTLNRTPPLITDRQVASGPLRVVPVGCQKSATATAVFVGELVLRDSHTAQYRIRQIRSGTLDRWAVGDQVQVRYDDGTRFLSMHGVYVVGASPDQSGARLISKIREPEPLFGGDAVVGVNDSNVTCPAEEDPVRTLTEAGQAVDSGLLTPLKSSTGALASAVLRPLAVAVLALFALVIVKQLAFATGRTLRGSTVTEQPWTARKRRRTLLRRRRTRQQRSS